MGVLICLIVGIALGYIALVTYLHLLPEMQDLWDWEKQDLKGKGRNKDVPMFLIGSFTLFYVFMAVVVARAWGVQRLSPQGQFFRMTVKTHSKR